MESALETHGLRKVFGTFPPWTGSISWCRAAASTVSWDRTAPGSPPRSSAHGPPPPHRRQLSHPRPRSRARMRSPSGGRSAWSLKTWASSIG
jgi:hypothetical protein